MRGSDFTTFAAARLKTIFALPHERLWIRRTLAPRLRAPRGPCLAPWYPSTTEEWGARRAQAVRDERPGDAASRARPLGCALRRGPGHALRHRGRIAVSIAEPGALPKMGRRARDECVQPLLARRRG